MLNNASFTLSVVGRVPVPGTAFSGLPFALPDTTLTDESPFLYVSLLIRLSYHIRVRFEKCAVFISLGKLLTNC